MKYYATGHRAKCLKRCLKGRLTKNMSILVLSKTLKVYKCKSTTCKCKEPFLQKNIIENFSSKNRKTQSKQNFRFLAKSSIIDSYCKPKFRFFVNISIFDQNFHFWLKFRLMTKISIFDQNFDFWLKFRFLTKISFVNHFWSFLRFFLYQVSYIIHRLGPNFQPKIYVKF